KAPPHASDIALKRSQTELTKAQARKIPADIAHGGMQSAAQMYHMAAATPNTQTPVDHSSTKQMLGEKPEGWRAALAGLLEGMESGNKSKIGKEKKEELQKFAKIMEYWENTAIETNEQNKWYETREKADAQLM